MPRSIQTWNALSDGYRKRLEANGITRSRYLSGEKLTGARGHAKTPERPERAFRNPEAYPEYIQKHLPGRGGGLGYPTVDETVRHVRAILIEEFQAGTIDRIDVSEIRSYIELTDPVTRLRMLNMTGDQYREQASIQQSWNAKRPARSWFVKIDRHWYNPFWYH